jgi:hypothetical protein
VENLNRQETTMKEVQQNNEKFVSEGGGGGKSGNARDEMMKKLAAANDAFFELKGNLQEGTKFYNDLTQLLVTFQNKVSSTSVHIFCFNSTFSNPKSGTKRRKNHNSIELFFYYYSFFFFLLIF